MNITLIVAMANQQVIGYRNQMPWHLSADLKRFKRITMGAPIVMGRKTYESISKPLIGRTNVIISKNPHYQQAGCLIFKNLAEALTHCCENSAEVFVIGGATLYEQVLPLATTLYLTQLHHNVAGDTFFPQWDKTLWTEVEREDINDDLSVEFSYSFLKLIKNQ